MAHGHHRDHNPSHGHEPTREAAMAAQRLTFAIDTNYNSIRCAAAGRLQPMMARLLQSGGHIGVGFSVLAKHAGDSDIGRSRRRLLRLSFC
jgi:hypothetical protein